MDSSTLPNKWLDGRKFSARLKYFYLEVDRLATVLKPHSLLTLSLLLIPSALLLSHNQDMPHFGDVHDDSLYYVSAKSIAEGSYKITSLPGEPWQTKYPPLYPLLLSVAWKIQPKFPDNLTIAAWLSWLAFPALLVQLALYFPRLGLSPGRCWILLCVVAMNPYFLLFGVSLLSDLPFAAALITAFLLLESGREKDNPVPWMEIGRAHV